MHRSGRIHRIFIVGPVYWIVTVLAEGRTPRPECLFMSSHTDRSKDKPDELPGAAEVMEFYRKAERALAEYDRARQRRPRYVVTNRSL